MLLWQVLFWSSALWIAYTFLFYPLLLWQVYLVVQIRRDVAYLIGRRERRAATLDAAALPGVSLVIPVHNEAARLPAKLANLRALTYPREKLEIIFIADGCTDGSDEYLAAHATECRLLRLPRQAGKALALNQGVAAACQPIVVLCDAATLLAPDAVAKLARHFHEPRVGAVCGALAFDANEESAATEGVYWRYECLLRLMEARLGATLTASGALYALRRDCFRPLPSGALLDDFLTPMAIRAQGYRIVFDPEARARDFAEGTIEGEFRRRVRLAVGSFQSLGQLLRAPADARTRWAFISHKVMRWFLPIPLLVLLASSIVLAAHPLFFAVLALQVIFYGLAAWGWWRGASSRPAMRAERAARGPRLAYYLLAMNAAFALGFWRAVSQREGVSWR